MKAVDAVSPVAAALAALIGGLVLAGWALDIVVAKRAIPGTAPLSANATVGVILAGASLWLTVSAPKLAWARWLARLSAAFLLFLGLATLVEYLTGRDVHIDRILSLQAFGTDRMAVATCVNFIFLGAALLLLGAEPRRRREGAIHVLVLLALMFSVFELLGYSYDFRGFALTDEPLAPMALPTALGLLLVCLGILMARPTFALRRLASMEGAAGTISRQLLAFAVGLPFALGWLILKGHDANVFTAGFALALFAVATIAGFSGAVLWNADTLEKAETIRRQSEADMRAASLYARSLLEASLDPLVTINAEGKITDVNRATEKVTGKNRADLIGTDFADYFTDPEKARAGYREVLRRGSVTDYPLAIRRKDGRITHVLYNASLYRDESGATAGIFAAARDVTARKRVEEELAEYHEHLQDLVVARTAELTEVNKRLESVNAELEAFAYSVSHDLRTPLRAVDGFSQILLEDYADRLDAEGRRLLNVVRDGARRMGRLIDDILAFSRVGRQEMVTARVDMDQAVRAELAELEPFFAGREVRFLVAPLPPCRGDGAMLRRVWGNLLQNAVKFTAPKAQAMIEVGARKAGNEIVYWVRDNGVGFDMRFADKLFGVFQRLHGGDSFPGTGIGLAIVKRIVTRHGGHVWAEGRVNEGATLFFALPTEEESHV